MSRCHHGANPDDCWNCGEEWELQRTWGDCECCGQPATHTANVPLAGPGTAICDRCDIGYTPGTCDDREAVTS